MPQKCQYFPVGFTVTQNCLTSQIPLIYLTDSVGFTVGWPSCGRSRRSISKLFRSYQHCTQNYRAKVNWKDTLKMISSLLTVQCKASGEGQFKHRKPAKYFIDSVKKKKRLLASGWRMDKNRHRFRRKTHTHKHFIFCLNEWRCGAGRLSRCDSVEYPRDLISEEYSKLV